MRAFLGYIRVHFIVALLALTVLSGCLKNNGEPYPGTASENNGSNTGGNLGSPDPDPNGGTGVKIEFPPGSIDEVISCDAELIDGSQVHVDLGINSSIQLTLQASLNIFREDYVTKNILAEAAAVSENHTDTMRSYLSSNVRLYIPKDRLSSAFPDTLKYKAAGTSTWLKASVKCNSTGYSEDAAE